MEIMFSCLVQFFVHRGNNSCVSNYSADSYLESIVYVDGGSPASAAVKISSNKLVWIALESKVGLAG